MDNGSFRACPPWSFAPCLLLAELGPTTYRNAVNEMVRRLISTLKRVIVLAGSRRIIDMQIRSVGIDLGKTTFHLVALSAAGKVLLRKKFTHKQLVRFTANLGLRWRTGQ
jgi:hypothetical protein